MLKIGEYQTLKIDRLTSVGFFLVDKESEDDVLLPNQYITDEMSEGDDVNVFVYRDNEERVIATTQKPFLCIGEFAYLEVKEITTFGAFVDWGLMKQLLVPYRNQANTMEVGKSYIVYMYEDELTQRLVGTTKIDALLKNKIVEDLEIGSEVDILVRGKSELGVKVIVDNEYSGLIFHSDVHKPIGIGTKTKAYIHNIREDGKLDIRLDLPGYEKIDSYAKSILEKLEASNGFLAFTDKSNPEDIREEFGVSKKVFKKALGALYKNRLIQIKDDGIHKS